VTDFDLKQYLHEKRQLVDGFLCNLALSDPALQKHFESLRYSLLAGGKRVRPILCLAAVETLHVPSGPFLPVACALECVHTYSLIHDDLPAMDNDDLRRGKPTSHKMFGEAEAILAGDGLLTLAFELLSAPELVRTVEPSRLLAVINLIAKAAGSAGMVGGQSLDIAAEGKKIDLASLQTIHRYKTGALITASVQAGAVLAGADEAQIDALTAYGRAIGLAFQIKDDLLNVEGTAEQLGKAAGSDAAMQKATYPALLGLDEANKRLQTTIDDAADALVHFDEAANPLRSIAQYILNRNR